MGYVRAKGTIRNLTDKTKWAEIEFIADTGVTTLERLDLEVDPVTGKLKPMELILR